MVKLTTQFQLLMTPNKEAFENIVGKGENAGNQHFLLCPQCFLSFTKQISNFQSHLFCRQHMVKSQGERFVRNNSVNLYILQEALIPKGIRLFVNMV